MYKASNGHPNATLTDISDENYYSEIVSATTSSAVVKTYTYKFNFKATPPYSNLGGQVNPQVDALKAAFTLYTLGDPLTSIKDNGDKGSEVNTSYFNVYPNPNSGNFKVGFSSKVESKGVLKLVNVIGTIMYEDSSIQIKQGINRFEVSINNLPKGIYFVNLDIENNKSLVRKIVIN